MNNQSALTSTSLHSFDASAPRLRDFSHSGGTGRHTQAKKASRTGLILTLASLGVFVGVSVFFASRWRSATQESVSAAEIQAPAVLQEETTDARPEVAQVAGVNSVADADNKVALAGGESAFGVVAADATCSQLLFRVGDVESQPTDHPADELNWVGALDVVPTFTNPFIVSVTPDSDFPWRVDELQPDTHTTTIEFEYAGADTQAQLVLSWSPGTTGSSYKKVTVNDTAVGTTPVHEGQLYAGASWNNLVFYADKVKMPLSAGKHELTIEHTAVEPGDAAVWDFIELTSCE